jgi:hypothetical protein
VFPDLSRSFVKADPELFRSIYEAFQFTVELDRNTPEIRMKALVPSAFTAAGDLDSIAATVAHKAIAGGGIRTRDLRVMSCVEGGVLRLIWLG